MIQDNTLKPGWQIWRFDQMATNVNDRINDPSKADTEYYVGLEHLDSDSLKIRRWGSPSDVEATKLRFRKGDIIFGRRRVYQRKVAVADFDGICSAHALVLRAKPDVVLPEFLPFFMQSDIFMERAKAISVGSLSPTINWKTLAKEEFALPPLETQIKLVEILLAINEVIESLNNLNNQNTQLYHSLLESRVKNYIHLGKPQKRLEEVCHTIVDGTHKTPTYLEKGVPFLRVTDINAEEIDWSSVKYISEDEHRELCKRCRPEKGDILLSKNGTIGITKVIDWEIEFSIFVSLCLLKPSQ